MKTYAKHIKKMDDIYSDATMIMRGIEDNEGLRIAILNKIVTPLNKTRQVMKDDVKKEIKDCDELSIRLELVIHNLYYSERSMKKLLKYLAKHYGEYEYVKTSAALAPYLCSVQGMIDILEHIDSKLTLYEDNIYEGTCNRIMDFNDDEEEDGDLF